MATLRHIKSKTTGEEVRNYISYFQSTTTIGIISRAKTPQDALLKANSKLSRSDFMCGVIGQTQFEPMATEEWVPSFSKDEESDMPLINPKPNTPSNSKLMIEITDKMKQKIATKLGKKPEEMTDALIQAAALSYLRDICVS